MCGGSTNIEIVFYMCKWFDVIFKE